MAACPGGQAEMGEDLGGDVDGGDDLQEATTLEAVFQVDLEHPLRPTGPSSCAPAPRQGAPRRGRLRRVWVDRHAREARHREIARFGALRME
jgi:hypothetical protein